MTAPGWMGLLGEANPYGDEKRYSIPAYSGFMLAPRLLRKPYGEFVSHLFSEDDPWGWPVSEYEEAFELRPGLEPLCSRDSALPRGA